MGKVAILSNVNIDMVSKLLPNQDKVFQPQGYGNAFSLLLNENSDLAKFSASVLFFIVDITSLTASALTYEDAVSSIDEWFSDFQSCVKPKIQYFISDVSFRKEYIEDTDDLTSSRLEAYWLDNLMALIDKYTNIHRFSLTEDVNTMGKASFYSEKLWYMGKIPFSSQGCRALADHIALQLKILESTPRKVLVLDLDNTLWGGIVGELGRNGIQLSDDKIGALYRDAQRMIKQMQKHGVILAVNSKNNPEDALEVINQHPHMVLREDDFSSIKINWESKPQNMQEIACELNLGLDSFVFIDDMPAEREAVRSLLPMVEVPEFPDTVEALPEFFRQIYIKYFQKLRMTREDTEKTRLYRENAKRNILEKSLDYDSFLENLKINIERVPCDNTSEIRLEQLLQKTNQFNLTTKRYSHEDIMEMKQNNWCIYLFRASDKFGDYGIIAAVLVNTAGSCPLIDSFVMSCRVMGKQVENYLIDYVESDLLKIGYQKLIAEYIPTAKNAPVKKLYDGLGYQRIGEEETVIRYEISLADRPLRSYHIHNSSERNSL